MVTLPTSLTHPVVGMDALIKWVINWNKIKYFVFTTGVTKWNHIDLLPDKNQPREEIHGTKFLQIGASSCPLSTVKDSIRFLASICDNIHWVHEGSSPEPWVQSLYWGLIGYTWLAVHRADLKFQSLQRSSETSWPKAPTLNQTVNVTQSPETNEDIPIRHGISRA